MKQFSMFDEPPPVTISAREFRELELAREERDRDRGRDVAAAKNDGLLELARSVALELGAGGREVSIEDVRDELRRRDVKVPSGNWMGSVFRRGWRRVGFVKAHHKGSHARVVSVWRRG